jgi:GNAT superfamily N-acetyltransferase
MAGGPETVGRRAGAEDIAPVAACLASAFYDDPLWGHWTFPDEDVRARDLLPLMTLMAELGLGGAEQTYMTDGAGAITVWTPPGAHYGEPGFDERIAQVLHDLFGDRAAALETLWERFAEHEPEGDYWHLEWWATRRDRRGEGLGTRLLHEDLARLDEAHLPGYLESSNPANDARYEALGFRPVGALEAPDGPTITTMWREAR